MSLPSAPRVVCVGVAALDAIAAVRQFPQPDSRVAADAVMLAGGGPAATAAVACVRLGVPAAFIGAIATDAAGDAILAGLRGEGVDLSAVLRVDGNSGGSVIVVDTGHGTRAICNKPGPTLAIAPGSAAAACIAEAEWVHADQLGWPALAELPVRRLSVDAGNPIPGSRRPASPCSCRRWHGCAACSGTTRSPGCCVRRLTRGAGCVVATDGAHGSFVAAGDQAWSVPALPGEVNSTLGAGDVFHGALLAATVRGLDLPVRVAYANITAALSCRALDGRSGIPGHDAVMALLPTLRPVSVGAAMTMTLHEGLRALARPNGAFAMLAVDQREAMRAMFAEFQDGPVSDTQVADFKLAAIRALTPYASAVLVDRQFAWERTVAEGAVAAGCGLIAAADEFLPGPDELVGDVRIDQAMIPSRVRAQGAVAMKLLVLWRPDEPSGPRIAMVQAFCARCRDAGLASIIEPISRRPRDGRAWDWNAGVLAAAVELGGLGADLYKAEVPLHGEGDETAIRAGCAQLTRTLPCPWVVLSSGVPQDLFPRAVALACAEGASGFLAGRAVWRGVIGQPDIAAALVADAVPRLQALVNIVDRAVAR